MIFPFPTEWRNKSHVPVTTNQPVYIQYIYIYIPIFLYLFIVVKTTNQCRFLYDFVPSPFSSSSTGQLPSGIPWFFLFSIDSPIRVAQKRSFNRDEIFDQNSSAKIKNHYEWQKTMKSIIIYHNCIPTSMIP